MIVNEKRFRSKLTLVTILEHITIQYIPKITYNCILITNHYGSTKMAIFKLKFQP